MKAVAVHPDSGAIWRNNSSKFPADIRPARMQTLPVNGYDMAYLDVGEGPPLVCVHGSLCDFRIWSCVLGPLSKSIA